MEIYYKNLLRKEAETWNLFLKKYVSFIEEICYLIFKHKKPQNIISIEEEVDLIITELKRSNRYLRGYQQKKHSFDSFLRSKIKEYFRDRIITIIDNEVLTQKQIDYIWLIFDHFYRDMLVPIICKLITVKNNQELQSEYLNYCTFLIDDHFVKLKKWNRKDSFENFIRTVFRNLIIDDQRKENKKEAQFDESIIHILRECPKKEFEPYVNLLRYEQKEFLKELETIIETWPEDERLIFELRFLDTPTLKPQEIEIYLGGEKTISDIYTIIGNSKKRLKKTKLYNKIESYLK